jgi:aminopeptidase N
MLRRHLGDEAFFKGINLYGTEHKFQSVETFDFRRSMERATQRDLERFFYDWLERPGNPALEANVGASPDGKELQIVFKQTQKEEEFHFPVKVVVHCSDTPERTVIEKEMTSKELTVRVPLAGTLLRVDIDPDQAILTHLKTTQSDALWQAQLVSGPDVAARLRAVQHFAGDKKDENRALIAKAFANEKFWAVSIEEAKALGNLGGNVCRDALLTGLQHLDPRVRRASVDALASFHGDASVVAALKEILSNGDKSYAVEGAALGAYTKMKQPDAVAQIAPWLSKPSFEDTLARDALRALGETRDPAALPFLLEWSKSEHSRHARTAAQLALIPMAENKELTDAQRRELVASLVDALKTSSGFERFRILTAIPKLGPLAKEALPALDELARVSNGRFKGAVMRVTEEIRKSAKSNGEVR